MLSKHLIILRELENEEIISSRELANRLFCNEKTIRNLINDIHQELDSDLATILSTRGIGHRLEIHEPNAYHEWYRRQYQSLKMTPQDENSRIQFILEKLLLSDNYLKREAFADALYVTDKTVTNDIRKVENILRQYDLSIHRRSHYGIRMIGNEFSIRQCLLNEVINRNDKKDLKVKEQLESLISKLIRDEKIVIPAYQINALIDYLALSIMRIRTGYSISDPSTEAWGKNVGIYYLAEYILQSIKDDGLIQEYNDCEVFYISLYILGNRLLNERHDTMVNYVIPTHSARCAEQMMEKLNTEYGFDYGNNWIFLNSLLNQTITTEIRMKYCIRMENPIMKEIPRTYPVAYAIAADVTSPLKDYLHKELTTEEISYFAILFQSCIPKIQFQLKAYAVINDERPEDYFLLKNFMDHFDEEVMIERILTKDEKITELHDCHLIVTTQLVESEEIPVIFLKYEKLLAMFESFEKPIHSLYQKEQKRYLEERILMDHPEYFAVSDVIQDARQHKIRWNITMIQYMTLIQ